MKLCATYNIDGREHTEYAEFENILDFKKYLNDKGIYIFILGEPSWDEWDNLKEAMDSFDELLGEIYTN